MNNKVNPEKISKLSIASLITGVSAVPFGFLVFCMSVGDPKMRGIGLYGILLILYIGFSSLYQQSYVVVLT